jgi:hypothetical protein
MDIVDSGVDVPHFVSLGVQRMEFLELHSLRFDGVDALPCLVEVAFRSFRGFVVVLLDVLDSQQRPTDKVPSLDSFEPHGFKGVTIQHAFIRWLTQ